ncbi:MAG: nucleoside triphosphate pyrophosphohydrolase [Flavobacteriales bacterium]|jgi:XTP/dITP diphosphohydrolase|tara:strand:- start:1136 stop:1924 length:789 start_codon:yes stop_codon:yes gene_type:complete
MNTREDKLQAFGRLLDIMDELREQCPWDKKQTMDSLRHLTIEETYELCDAILDNDMEEVKKELGDILLHMVFYAKLGSEKKAFDIADVLNGICEKLIFRHPHIYGDVEVQDEEEVKRNWEKLKLQEKGENSSVLEGVPTSLPALVKAVRMQDKVRGIGFDFANKKDVWAKVKEELAEFEAEVEVDDTTKMEAEFGDLLFSLVNYSRHVNINPEDALERTNKKFRKRFQAMENAIHVDNKNLSDMNLAQMDVYWEKVKKELEP